MSPKPSEVAAEAAVWGYIETEAKKRKDEARQFLTEHMGPDLLAVKAKYGDTELGRATFVEGKTAIKVADAEAFLAFVAEHYPLEVVTTIEVNPAFKTALLAEATLVDGKVIDKNGVPIDGVETRTGASYVTVNKAKDIRDKVADLLAAGRVSLEGVKAIEPPADCGMGNPAYTFKPEPTDRYTQDREAGAIG